MSKWEYLVWESPRGWISVLGSAEGLIRLSFPQPTREDALIYIDDAVQTGAVENRKQFEDLANRLNRYFRGEKVVLADKLDLTGATPFRRDVWLGARAIPWGETRSYGWLAKKMGKPGGARAVGQALGKNPLPIIIPCHRVIGSDGGLCGFSGGLDWKAGLLKLEAGSISPQR